MTHSLTGESISFVPALQELRDQRSMTVACIIVVGTPLSVGGSVGFYVSKNSFLLRLLGVDFPP